MLDPPVIILAVDEVVDLTLSFVCQVEEVANSIRFLADVVAGGRRDDTVSRAVQGIGCVVHKAGI